MPSLRADSNSRIVLKARFVGYLDAAARAAQLGSDFVGHQSGPDFPGRVEHVATVQAALGATARDFARWRVSVAKFDTYDRDNWEDELLSFERSDMANYGSGAWTRVVTAVTAGTVGTSVKNIARSEAACRGLFS